MDKKILEIRWHGRGGQGAKTASILLAKIAAATGKYIQAFPEYGPERMGAPVLAYTRIKNSPIYQHCQIEKPDMVVVLDSTLLGTVDITQNIIEDGEIIINTQKSPEKIAEDMGLADNITVYTLDADKISEEEIGRVFPNTPLLGAFNKISGLMPEKDFLKQAEKEFGKKFGNRTEIIDGNMGAVKRAFQEVKGA